ncbi:S-layer homology domain-containing protein [Metasolibacillus sp.]|uniref:S-layer homology domain-containing protein n=1 Tax=Metasolibacillus sp. TaxID=2703680 RepID=UPI0025F0B3BE|nr:S-layer homology domain-containing protein [Metasolibacillus sp.]MCT6923027.1 S-layer homology domain-containing protein [Metasolibacillus sp.]MCT6939265.1 S-layer homology domain-containing protein [Metasolibacillus sp.]
MISSVNYMPIKEVQAAANGTADGTYDFGGVVGIPNSAEIGFTTFSDKFAISNGFAVDGTQLYKENGVQGEEALLIIKSRWASMCKTFTFKDLGVSLYFQTPKTKLTKFSLVIKDINGDVLGTHEISNHDGIEGHGVITQLSTLLNNGTQFNYTGVANLEIKYQLGTDSNSNLIDSSSLNFENITIANVSTCDTQPPIVSNGVISSSNISTTGVTLGWTKATDNVTAQGDLEYLVYQSSSNNINTVSNIEANGTPLGSGFTKDIATFNVTGLSPSTTYYFNVIVKDAMGNKTAYTMQSVTTAIPASAPTVTTSTPASNITTTEAMVGGNVIADGGAAITERGIVYATTTNPTTSNDKRTTTGSTGAFTANLSGLSPNTTYHYRAYATNSVGTSYGDNQSFTTVALSNNSNLSNLTLSTGVLTPSFASATVGYTVNVATNVESIQVTPTVADSTATVTVNGATVTSGQASGSISLNVGSNPITILVTAQNNTTKTYTITVYRAAPTYTIEAIGNQTFTALTAGYPNNTQETKTLTITNTGTGSLTDVAVALSGANANAFEITQPSLANLPSTGSTTFEVKAKDGLATGTYTATVTVNAASLTSVTFTVTQVVNPAPTYTIDEISNQTFTALTAGYTSGSQETKTVPITNTGTGSLSGITVGLSGTNASDFEITQPTLTSLPSTDSTAFTVKAKDGLAEGTYTATVTVNATNLTTPVTFTVTQVVNPVPTYTIDAISNQTFTGLTEGYPNDTQEIKSMTITNTGTGNLTNLGVTLSGPNASDFEITQPLVTNLASASNTAFTVKAKDGLGTGTYTATVTITATDLLPVTFTVTQVINPAPTYTIDAISDQTLTVLTAGYTSGTQETKAVPITNTGTGSLLNLDVALSGPNASDFEITQPLVTNLASAGNTTFTVKAKDDLTAGTYTATVTVNATNLTPVTFTVTQVVNPAPTYKINAISDQTFSVLTEGYASNTQEMKSISITNTGTGILSNVDVALSGSNASDFEITQPLMTNLLSAGSTTFTVKAKDDLTAGTYTATVTVTATNLAPVTFTVTQVVSPASMYTIDPIGNQMFTSLTAGYPSGTQETKLLTITNTATGDLANIEVALSGSNANDFTITQPLVTNLTSADSTTFTVKAKDGLAAGTYTATVTVSATNLTPMTFTVTQMINPISVTTPGVPTNVRATAGNGFVTVSFDAPTSNGGDPITGYTVKVYINGVEQPMLAKTGTSSPIVVNGLANGTAYTFKVVATNGVGSSGESLVSNIVTPVAAIAPYPIPGPIQTPPIVNPSTTITKIKVALEVDGVNPLETIMVEIERTKHANGEITDYVALSEADTKQAIEKAKQSGNNIVRIIIPDVHDEVTKVTVEIPKQSLQLLRENRLSLEIATENGRIMTPYSSMEGINDTFYFNLVPVKKESERQIIEERARTERVVRDALQSNDVHVIGRPMVIETNMPSRPVQLTLPLKGVEIPTDTITREAFLKQLAIFIEHSDGEKKVVIPEVVTVAKGALGLRFTVEKFSTFTIIQVETKEEQNMYHHEAYIKGFPDGTFGPDKNVTRVQVATMIARILGYTGETVDTAPFKDIPSDHYAAGAIAFVKERGIMNGDNGYFRVGENMTRAQMAAVVAKFKQLPIAENVALTFNDTKGHWAQWIIEANRTAGIINGREDGSFAPNEPLTRAQAVAMLNRMFERGPLQGITMPSFPDVKATHWAFGEIEEAARSHTYFIDENHQEIFTK